MVELARTSDIALSSDGDEVKHSATTIKIIPSTIFLNVFQTLFPLKTLELFFFNMRDAFFLDIRPLAKSEKQHRLNHNWSFADIQTFIYTSSLKPLKFLLKAA